MIDLYPAYKPFRNFMRKFALQPSLLQIWGYYPHITSDQPLHPDLARGVPTGMDARKYIHAWDLEILVRELILNAGTVGRDSLFHWKHLADAVNHVRRLEGAPYDGSSQANALVDLQRMTHRQFVWQSGSMNTAHLVRAMKIFGRGALDAAVLDATGLNMRQMIRLAMAVTGRFNRDARQSIIIDTSSIGIDPAASRAMLERVTSDLKTLRQDMQQHQQYNDAWLYATNPLEHRPLIRLHPSRTDEVICPVPRYLLRRLTSGIYYDIVNSAGFANAYGESFQAYIGEVIAKTISGPRFRVTEEQPYAAAKGKLKHGIDWIVSDDSGHLFIECKAKRPALATKQVTDQSTIDRDLATMAIAVVQTYKNILDAQNGLTAWRPDGLPIYPVVVTLEEWYLFSTHYTARVRREVQQRLVAVHLDPDLVNRMPYTIASCTEFEHGIQIVAARGIAEVFSGKTAMPHRDWGLAPFLLHQYPAESKASVTLLFPEDAQRLLPEFKTTTS